jgi:hypothetical protein
MSFFPLFKRTINLPLRFPEQVSVQYIQNPQKTKRQRRRCPKKPSELPIARITTNIHRPLDNNRSLRIIARSITITIPRTRFHKSLRLPRARRDPSGAGGARSAVLAVPGVTNARSGSGGSVFAASGAAEGCYVFGSC